jgi:hypothetical protein
MFSVWLPSSCLAEDPALLKCYLSDVADMKLHLIAMHPWPIQSVLVRERASSTTPSRRHTTARPPRQRFLIGGCGCQRTAVSGRERSGQFGAIEGEERTFIDRATERLLADLHQTSHPHGPEFVGAPVREWLT